MNEWSMSPAAIWRRLVEVSEVVVRLRYAAPWEDIDI